MDGQDWNPVVMRKYKPGGAAAKPTPVSMNAVRKEKHIYICACAVKEMSGKRIAWRGEYECEKKKGNVSLTNLERALGVCEYE